MPRRWLLRRFQVISRPNTVIAESTRLTLRRIGIHFGRPPLESRRAHPRMSVDEGQKEGSPWVGVDLQRRRPKGAALLTRAARARAASSAARTSTAATARQWK